MKRTLRNLAIALGLLGIILATAWFGTRPSPANRFQLGLKAAEQENWPEVLRQAEALKGRPDFASEVRLLQAIYLLKTDRPASALKELSTIEPVGQLRNPALLYAGEAFYRQDRLFDAEKLFATLASENPDSLPAHRWLAAVAYDSGNMNYAMDELAQVSRLSPTDFRPYILKGQILADLERFAEAATSYQTAASLSPPPNVLAEVLPALARAQIAVREYDPALQSLSTAPSDATNLALAAECHLGLGRPDEAREIIERAIALDANQPDVLKLHGRLELDAGRAESARQSLQKLVDLDPHDHTSRHELAQALRMLGQTTAAEEQSRLSTQSIDLKARLAALSLEAIARPRDAEVRTQMANLCEQLGRPLLAATWRKAANACNQAVPVQPAKN
jgi:tetratricopeptide (TPR) repeat protein